MQREPKVDWIGNYLCSSKNGDPFGPIESDLLQRIRPDRPCSRMVIRRKGNSCFSDGKRLRAKGIREAKADEFLSADSNPGGLPNGCIKENYRVLGLRREYSYQTPAARHWDRIPTNGSGGRLSGSVSCGIAVQVCTQCCSDC